MAHYWFPTIFFHRFHRFFHQFFHWFSAHLPTDHDSNDEDDNDDENLWLWSQRISHLKSCLTIPKSTIQLYHPPVYNQCAEYNLKQSSIHTLMDIYTLMDLIFIRTLTHWWILMDTDIVRQYKIPSYKRTLSANTKSHHINGHYISKITKNNHKHKINWKLHKICHTSYFFLFFSCPSSSIPTLVRQSVS